MASSPQKSRNLQVFPVSFSHFSQVFNVQYGLEPYSLHGEKAKYHAESTVLEEVAASLLPRQQGHTFWKIFVLENLVECV